MGKLLFEWVNPDKDFDYLRISLLLPTLTTRKSTSIWSGQPCTWVGFSAPTEFSFSTEEDIDWRLIAELFGFGICVQRQWSY